MAVMLKLSLLLMLAYLASAEERRIAKDDIVNPFVCIPGTTFKEDCNFCTCTSDGDRACTLMDCNLEHDQCIPGTVFEIRDALCRCPDCGYKWHSDCFAGNYCRRDKVPV